ncbi:hypothetical protein O6H91_19G033200 [Diphasiastrum complanatum]|uniref:Uncharacterized protein n=1 Tax=Diphasiastrum complanatum TaxID=34168 RepID=A0ACC2AU10_DIPCM|nr:hypothetical protein O6H91_19G033200 [Diphasiastrum complanatum]
MDHMLRLLLALSMLVLTWVAVGMVLPAAAAAKSPSGDQKRWQNEEGEVLSNDRLTQVLGTDSLALQFVGFANRHGKVYRSEKEVQHRFLTFKDNWEYIRESNTKNLSYTLGVNKFADLSWEEFKQEYLMKSTESSCVDNKGTNPIRKVEYLPKQQDWRKYGVVSPVKNQKQCGSCWAFSTTGALESAHALATGQLVLLSEQQLVDCGGSFDKRNLQGCNGGWPSSALEYVKYNDGLDTESSYPYEAKDGFCNYNVEANGAKVYNVINITQGAEEELQQVVGLLQPVSVCFEVTKPFRFYNGGVFSSSDCQVAPQDLNHAVLAVGYNQDENVTPYWIVKNSWGPSWGVNGYFNAELGIASCATYPTSTETTGAASF